MKRPLFLMIASALVLGYAARAEAATASDPMNVTLTVSSTGPGATISADDLNFGTSAGEDRFATTSVRVTIPAGATYTIYLDAGLHYLTGTSVRNLSSGTNLAPYVLSKNTAGTDLWGDGVNAGLGTGVTGGGTGALQSYTVYAGVHPVGSTGPVPNGTYTDVVVATVNF